MGCFFVRERRPTADERFYAAMYGYAFVVRRHVLREYNRGLDESRALTAARFDIGDRVDSRRMRGAFERVGVPYGTYWFVQSALCNGEATYDAAALGDIRTGDVLADLDSVIGVPMYVKRAFVEVVSSTTGEKTAPRRYYAGMRRAEPL